MGPWMLLLVALGREEGDSQVAAGVASETVASCVPSRAVRPRS